MSIIFRIELMTYLTRIQSWRIRLNSLPTLVVFFYRNLMGISNASVSRIMDLMLSCLSDDNVEVREMASSALSGIVRVSQRQSIIPLKVMPHRALFSRPMPTQTSGPFCESHTQSQTSYPTGPRLSRIVANTTLCNSWPLCTSRELPIFC